MNVSAQHRISDTRKDLIQAVYQVAVDPHSYDQLVELWGEYLMTTLSETSMEWESQPHIAADVATHLQRSFEILDRLGRMDTENAQSGLAELTIDAAGVILDANETARSLLGAEPGTGIRDLEMTAETAGRLGRLQQDGSGNDILLIFDKQNRLPMPLLRSTLPRGQMRLTSLTHSWSEAHDQVLQNLFGLTGAETRVARELLNGASLPELANATGRSVDTLRTQLKAIRRKTYTSSQQQLVRIMTGLENLPNIAAKRRSEVDGFVQNIRLPDGRRLTYLLLGPPGGTPCLFIHNMLNGPRFSAQALSALQTHKLRLICPIRPAFGESDIDNVTFKTPSKAPARFAEDMARLCANLGLKRVVAVGHMSGAVYAFHLAQARPNLVAGVFNISGGVPIREFAQFAAMNRRQKVIALTARFTPKMLPSLLRSGIAQLDAGGAEAFLNALYPHGTADRETAEAPHMRDLLYDGFRQIVRQGHWGFAIDAWHVVRDWTHYCKNVAQPVHLLHGAQDPVVSVKSVTDFADRMSFDSQVLEQCGQLILYKAPEMALGRLARLARTWLASDIT